MDNITTREGQYCAAPICLLYVNGENQLVPIAIQLKQEASEDNPIFLPSDHLIDWLLAKIYYQSAHSQVSIIVLVTGITRAIKFHRNNPYLVDINILISVHVLSWPSS